jgi:hypothetical protein
MPQFGVVGPAPHGVAEHLPRRRDCGELPRRGLHGDIGLPGLVVRVEVTGPPAVRGLDLLLSRITRDAEDRVVVALARDARRIGL